MNSALIVVTSVPSRLERLGLDRGDGRRPDGLMVFPFQRRPCPVLGKHLRGHLQPDLTGGGGAAARICGAGQEEYQKCGVDRELSV